ncbi:S9 family peptidase [Pseudopontixanthobacter vadosimaris]|uniref:S9 family peptidase n=1 Tax=Pseudopontixanthobacter vadosimaris TaxID=2726450 RepID=UPI001F11806D|nr:DPP IV N-terminal domain-containing protein [Pseudopontixanthobacter vadosimaris]
MSDRSDAASAPATAAGELDFARVFASPSLDGAAPRGVKLSPDGRYLTLLRNRETDRERYDLWAYDRETEDWRMLVDSEKLGSGRALSEAEKMQRERLRIGSLKGIVNYEWAADGEGLLVPVEGDLYYAALDGNVRRLTNTEAGELNPALSPRGGFVSFVRDGRLFTGQLGGAEPVAITPPETAGTVHWGEAEFVAQEEIGRRTGYWWNPDDRRIAVARFDEEPVATVTRAAIGAEGTETFEQRYPLAGTANVDIALFIMDPDGTERVQVDLGNERDIYLARVDWAPDGRTLYVQRQNREQTRLDMLAVDPATGASRVLFTEESAPRSWINLTDNYRFLKDGSLIWWSERGGFGHLYHLTDGDFRPLTSGDWMVTDLVGVDEEAGRVFFTATKDDILATQIYALDLAAPGNVQRLSDPEFVNTADMDSAGRTLIVQRSNHTQPPQSYLADTSGNRLAWIAENRIDADHPYAPYLASHRPAEFGTIEGPDGTPLHYRMVRPEPVEGEKRPVLFYHYGGPHAQVVTRRWRGALEQAVVDAGYIWFELDNRGSANRGVAFEQPIYRAMGSVEVADQRAGAEFLKTIAFVDADKVATYGWSYGGYMTLRMLEADPGLYAAGIAGAPVTKWELYDTHYTERYMGNPITEPAPYAVSGVIENAARITDPLLLIHGLADDNVVFENSSALIAKMQAEAVPFEMMLYPGQTHSVGGPMISLHLWNSIMAFLARNGVAPDGTAD